VESMSNPLIQVADLSAVASFCQKHGLTPVVDNTFATPVLCTPASMGFIVIHSATKYLNGHSDLLAGVVSGPQIFIEQACSWPSCLKYCEYWPPSARCVASRFVLDNSFAGPVLCNSGQVGSNVTCSATKYLNGTQTFCLFTESGSHEYTDKGGLWHCLHFSPGNWWAVSFGQVEPAPLRANSADLMCLLLWHALKQRAPLQVKEKMVMYGGCLDPHACFLLNRGMQTLGLRVRMQCKSALAIAQMLEKHPLVSLDPLCRR
jgi:cystathionine beta-lyase/cystathionine gamma-synthase